MLVDNDILLANILLLENLQCCIDLLYVGTRKQEILRKRLGCWLKTHLPDNAMLDQIFCRKDNLSCKNRLQLLFATR